jgi:hypothetical protein
MGVEFKMVKGSHFSPLLQPFQKGEGEKTFLRWKEVDKKA